MRRLLTGSGFKEEPTLFRTIGLLTCAGIIAGSIWVAGSLRAQSDPDASANPFADLVGGDQSSSDADSTTKAEDSVNVIARRKVDGLLMQSKDALKLGQPAQALRLALQADQVARQWNLTYDAGAESPQQWLATLQGKPADVTVPKGADPATRKAIAERLLAEARDFVEKGDFEAARQRAKQAEGIEVVYTPFDTRPEHILAEIERRTPASPVGPSEELVAGLQVEEIEQPVSIAPPAQAEPSGKTDKARALELLSFARGALQRGDVAEARQLALEASRLKVSYSLVDDRPELVLAAIDRTTGGQTIAASAAPSEPVEVLTDRDRPWHFCETRVHAITNGDIAQAQELALQARSMDVAYGLTDDRPELVLRDIDRASRSNRRIDCSKRERTPHRATCLAILPWT